MRPTIANQDSFPLRPARFTGWLLAVALPWVGLFGGGCRDTKSIPLQPTLPAPPARLVDEPPPVLRELIQDGGFEGQAPGPWTENNWAGNEVEFTR
ncbi:MAG: hypothetical protein U1E27_10805, partial [Kiritimatiellia bacterium]|nr:hypothetical protein [Kiritimatiellia bacterium]